MTKFLSYIDQTLGILYDRIIKSSATHGLTNYRILIGLFFLYFFSGWDWMANKPSGFYDPPLLSIGNLFSSFAPPWLFYTADILFIFFLILFTLGIRVRLSLIVLFLIGFIMSSQENSFGKIDHTSLTWFTFALLTLTSIDGKTRKHGTALIAVMICFGLFTAGFQKSLNWVDFNLSTSGFLKWFYECYFRVGDIGVLSEYIFELPIEMIELMDYAVSLRASTSFSAL